MNRCRWVLLVGVLVAGIGLVHPTAAPAETWNWTIQTLGSDAFWTSPTSVPTGRPSYDYTAAFLTVKGIEAELAHAVWIDVTDQLGNTAVPPGTAFALPFDIVPTDHVSATGILEIDIHHWVDATGHGQWSMTNPVFGILLGLPITGFRGTGTTTVTPAAAVPEPASMAMLLGGAIAAAVIGLRRWKR